MDCRPSIKCSSSKWRLTLKLFRHPEVPASASVQGCRPRRPGPSPFEARLRRAPQGDGRKFSFIAYEASASAARPACPSSASRFGPRPKARPSGCARTRRGGARLPQGPLATKGLRLWRAVPMRKQRPSVCAWCYFSLRLMLRRRCDRACACELPRPSGERVGGEGAPTERYLLRTVSNGGSRNGGVLTATPAPLTPPSPQRGEGERDSQASPRYRASALRRRERQSAHRL
jgi:hypothetical protein